MGNELFLKCNLVFASTCLCMNWNSLSHSDSLEPHGQYISWILQAIILEWVSDTWNKFSCSVMSDSLRPSCTAAHQASLSITKSQSLLKHIHWVGDAIQPSHPLLSPSPPAFNLTQHRGLFKWVSSLHQVARVLKFQLQHQSFQRTHRTDLLSNGLFGSPCSPRDSPEFFLQHHCSKPSILQCSASFIV